MRGLVVLYDAHCGFCVRCRKWLEHEPKYLPMTFLPAGSPPARARFPTLYQDDVREELVVIDDEGGVYRGTDAWIICLYALQDHRDWSVRLARPGLRPFARVAFEWLSNNRKALSQTLRLAPEEQVARTFAPMEPSACELGGGRS